MKFRGSQKILIFAEIKFRNREIGLLRKLNNALPRLSLLTIYKSFIRPHLDYGDVIYGQAYAVSFHQKIESVQYNSALAIRGTIRVTSKEKFNMSYVWNPLKKEDSTGNCAVFIKYSEPISRISIQYYSYFHETIQHKKC